MNRGMDLRRHVECVSVFCALNLSVEWVPDLMDTGILVLPVLN